MAVKLFAVYLGGRAPRCNTELHDVVFVVGETIESTYGQLMSKWFGTPEGLHIDSWIELRVVDGYRVILSKARSNAEKKLFFINLGAYIPGEFTEAHANAFLVAGSDREVKLRAKEQLLRGLRTVHTDDLYDLDDCLEVSEVDGYRVVVEPSSELVAWEPNNGYHIIPKRFVREFMKQRSSGAGQASANF